MLDFGPVYVPTGEQGLWVWEVKAVWGLANDDIGKSAGFDISLSFPTCINHKSGL